jgi:hypothetical protein
VSDAVSHCSGADDENGFDRHRGPVS